MCWEPREDTTPRAVRQVEDFRFRQKIFLKRDMTAIFIYVREFHRAELDSIPIGQSYMLPIAGISNKSQHSFLMRLITP